MLDMGEYIFRSGGEQQLPLMLMARDLQKGGVCLGRADFGIVMIPYNWRLYLEVIPGGYIVIIVSHPIVYSLAHSSCLICMSS